MAEERTVDMNVSNGIREVPCQCEPVGCGWVHRELTGVATITMTFRGGLLDPETLDALREVCARASERAAVTS